jgi:hypothetical protein
MTGQRWLRVAMGLLASAVFSAPVLAAKHGHSPVQYGPDYYKNHPDQDPANKNKPPPPAPTTRTDVAHDNIVTARQQVAAAVKAYDELIKKLGADFEQSADVTSAKQAVTDATTEYDKAKAPLLASLQQKPEYQKAVAAREDADKKLAQLRASGATQDKLSTAAQDLLTARQAVASMESNAIAVDATIKPQQKTLDDAQGKLTKLHADFHDSLKSNSDVIAAQKAKDDATAALDQAEEKVAAK